MRYVILKANHNCLTDSEGQHKVVYQVKDTIFWKQITTKKPKANALVTLFIKSKIQFSESKSQRGGVVDSLRCSCLSSQRYNFLKANHNRKELMKLMQIVVYQVKDTIFWKQITTYYNYYWSWIWLFIKSKIQFFESKFWLHNIFLNWKST